MKVLPARLRLNGHIIGFCPQTQKLEPLSEVKVFILTCGSFVYHTLINFTAGYFVLMSFALHAMTMKYSGSFLPQIVPSPFELVSIFYQSLLLPSLPCVPTVSKYKER